MNSQPHRVVIRRGRRLGGHPFWRAVCATCGWTGIECERLADADDDGDGHVIAMTRAEP